MPKPMWAALKPLARSLLHTTTVGTLPPRMRQKAGLTWSADDERRLARISASVRRISAATPPRVLHYPIAYGARKAARAYAEHQSA
jgi:uncharacterized protein (DUF2236 family)